MREFLQIACRCRNALGEEPLAYLHTRRCRWIGAARFTIGALLQILLKRTHTARIAFLTADAAAASASASASASVSASASAALPAPSLGSDDLRRVPAPLTADGAGSPSVGAILDGNSEATSAGPCDETGEAAAIRAALTFSSPLLSLVPKLSTLGFDPQLQPEFSARYIRRCRKNRVAS